MPRLPRANSLSFASTEHDPPEFKAASEVRLGLKTERDDHHFINLIGLAKQEFIFVSSGLLLRPNSSCCNAIKCKTLTENAKYKVCHRPILHVRTQRTSLTIEIARDSSTRRNRNANTFGQREIGTICR